MKLRYFTLIVVMVLMFSLGSVVASENLTDDASLFNDAQLAIGNNNDFIGEDLNEETKDTDNVLNPEDSSVNVTNDEIDLIVDMKVKNAYAKNEINRAGFEVPWTIIVTANGGTAQNVIINQTFSDNIKYLSHNATVGEYDSVTGIWHIGDLSNTNNASLTIFTQLKRDGTFINTVDATTDSNGKILSKSVSIKTGSSKITSNTTETSDDKNRPQHNSHYASETPNTVVREIEEESTVENSNTVSVDTQTKSKADKNSQSSSSYSSASSYSSPSSMGSSSTPNVVDSLVKTATPVTQGISDTIESIGNSIVGMFSPSGSVSNNEGSDSKENSSNAPVKAISASNYTNIPILIFALFLIILLPMVAYNKFKS